MPRSLVRAVVLVALGALSAPVLAQTTWYVPSAAAPTVVAAVANAATGDNVIVSPGTWNGNIDLGSKQLLIQSTGGYSVTTLHGLGAGPVVRIAGGQTNATRLEGFTINGGVGAFEQPGGILISAASPIIQSCRIQNNMGGPGGAAGTGGIELNQSNAKVTACLVDGNTGGSSNSAPYRCGAGGIICRGGSPLIENCSITGNHGGAGAPAGLAGKAGGVHCQDGTQATITGCVFSGNVGTSAINGANGPGAGGIHVQASSPTISLCTFTNNTGGLDTSSGQGGIPAAGGISSTQSGNPTITDCSFVQNHGGASLTISNADGRGGGGGVHVQGASATVVRSSFTSNVGGGGHRFGGGGGAAVFMGTLTLDHCQLTLNEGGPEGTVAGGGAITCESGTLTITACAVHANLGGLYGGTNPTSPRVSGGILSFSTMLLMENCVLAANVSTAATLNVPGGLHIQSGSAAIRSCTIQGNQGFGAVGSGIFATSGAGVLVANTIVWGNVPAGLLATGTATASVSYSCLQAPISGTGNIVTDPLFVSASTGDLSLTSASPCIDAGDPALAAPDLDLNGLFRRIDGNLDAVMRADMGAIEFTNVRLTGPTVVTPATLLTWTVNGPVGGVGGVWFSLAPGFTVFPPFGALFLDPNLALELVGPRPLPFTFSYFTAQPLLPGTIYLQGYGVDPAFQLGNLSNVLVVTAP